MGQAVTPFTPESYARQLLAGLPRGESLETVEWSRRHRGIVWLLACHAVGVPLFSFMTGLYVRLVLVGEGLVLACVILSQTLSHDARLRAALAMCGLIFASILLVHPSGGYVESHILVMMAGIVLHQGLVISKRLVEMMHGSIGVESEPGAGSRFWFTVQFTEQRSGASAMSRDSGVGHIAA